MIEKHAIFQGYYFFHHLGLERHLRKQFKDHPPFDSAHALMPPPSPRTAKCCPLAFCEPMLRRIFAQPRRSIYQKPDGSMA